MQDTLQLKNESFLSAGSVAAEGDGQRMQSLKLYRKGFDSSHVAGQSSFYVKMGFNAEGGDGTVGGVFEMAISTRTRNTAIFLEECPEDKCNVRKKLPWSDTSSLPTTTLT